MRSCGCRSALFLLVVWPIAAAAQGAASVEQGRALLKEHGCNGGCHQSHAEDDDPLTLYTRSDRKVRTRAQLDAQVNTCASTLGTMIFPEDVQSLSAALDGDFYAFE